MGNPEPLHDALARSRLLLTPEEAAGVLSIGRTTVSALIRAGDLRPVHIGRSCRLSHTEFERYVRQLATPTPTGRTGAAPGASVLRSPRRRTNPQLIGRWRVLGKTSRRSGSGTTSER